MTGGRLELLVGLGVLFALSACSTISDGEIEAGTAQEFSLEASSAGTASRAWTGWRGAAGDAVAELSLPDNWSETWSEIWRVPVGSGVAGVVVAEGRVYASAWREGEGEVTSCHDALTGEVRWSKALAVDSYSQPFEAWSIERGPLATPSLVDGRLYVVGSHGHVQCFDAGTGDLVFRLDPEDFGGSELRYGHAASPLVADGRLYVSFTGDPGAGQLLAVDAATGQVLWRGVEEMMAYTSPLAIRLEGVDQILCRPWEWLRGHDPRTGEVLWEFEVPGKGMLRDCATPVVLGEVIYLTNKGHGTTAVRVRRGEDGAWSAERVFRSGNLACDTSTPIVYGEHLYGLHRGGYLVSIEARTGARTWRERGFGKHLSLLRVGSRALALNEEGRLAQFRLESTRFLLEGRADIGEYTWAHPAVDEARFYFRDGEDLVAIGFGAER